MSEYRPVTVIDASEAKRLRVRIEVPVEDMARMGADESAPTVVPDGSFSATLALLSPMSVGASLTSVTVIVSAFSKVSVPLSVSPPPDGGSPITGYTANCTSSDGGAPGSNTGADSPITVTNLTNGSTYTCTVTATNADGEGLPSPPS